MQKQTTTYKIRFTKGMKPQVQPPKPPRSFPSYKQAYMYAIGRWGSATHLGWLEHNGKYSMRKKVKESTDQIGWYIEE